MDAVIEMDIINARARHSHWLSAVRPAFYDRDKEKGSISISGQLRTCTGKYVGCKTPSWGTVFCHASLAPVMLTSASMQMPPTAMVI